MASSIFADECIAMKDVEIQQGAAPQTASGDTSTKSRTHRIVEIDKCLVIGLSEEDEVFYTNFSKAQRRRVRTKIDVRLLPVLCMLYMLTMLDRTNIGNAKIENLMDDIHLADSQYNDALAVFFLPYCLMAIPSNLILKSLKRPSLYLGALVLAFGLVMTCHGFIRDLKDLIIVRLLLGAAQAGFYPGTAYLCSMWYRPHELALRFAVFSAVSAASGSISGVLAAGIVKMDGMGGYEGWRWMFIVEGCLTMILGLLTWFILVDSPERSSSWLTPDEIRYLKIQGYVKEGGRTSDEPHGSKLTDFRSIICDWRFWAFGLMLHMSSACSYGLKFFMPTIIHEMGYSNSKAQLLSAIPYIFGVCAAFGAALGSDILARRSIFVIAGFTSMFTGFCIILGLTSGMVTHKAGIIVSFCLISTGLFSASCTGDSWVANNIPSASKKAIGLAFVLTLGSSGGLTGSFIYSDTQAPRFLSGLGVSCGFAGVALLVALGLLLSFSLENRSRRNTPEEVVRATYTEKELKNMGHKSPLFRYTL